MVVRTIYERTSWKKIGKDGRKEEKEKVSGKEAKNRKEKKKWIKFHEERKNDELTIGQMKEGK